MVNGKRWLLVFLVSWAKEAVKKFGHTIAPLTAKSRFKMFFAGTSPLYIDADHDIFPGTSGGLARLA
jgi:hypothetical protein